MIDVQIKKQSNYPVATEMIRDRLVKFLTSHGVVSDSLVSVAIVGEKQALRLSKEFLKESPATVHNVLSFTETETTGEFVPNPEDKIVLGEIVVCYSKAQEEAIKEGIAVDEYVIQLIEHGALHLMGIHHD